MQCPRCQQNNRDDARFCRACGAAFETVCPACGAKVEPGGKFCDHCGGALATARSLQEAPARFASPDFYTPSHLANKILTSKAALEGELKQVTVLHADMKGSTEYVADLDPDDARRLLDPMLQLMMDAVHQYEGTVNQVMGDGIMALFGAPLSYEDHAIRACYSALTMQESIKKYAEEVRRTEGIPLQIRVGMNSGEVLVRSIGSDLHMNYTAQGVTSHLSARMEQMAIPGTILITSHTHRLAEGYVAAKSLGPMVLKGLPAPVETYELLGANAVRSRLEAVATRGLTPFVGRLSEIEQMRHALEQAQDGHGQFLALVGEPGAGKSRLVHQFIHSPLTEGWRILRAGATPYRAGTSYLPVTELLKTYFQIETSDEPASIREKVTGKLLTLDARLLPLLPTLLMLLDLPPEDHQSTLDHPQHRQRTLEAVKRLLFRESEVQPLLVVIEGLHSIDLETQVLVDGLIDSLAPARLVLLVSHRPEYVHEWGGKTYYTRIRVDPFTPAAAREMLNTLLGEDDGLEPIKHLLIDRTAGNPFFLEESVRTLVETGALSGKPGAYRATKPISDLRVPETLDALLTSRIDRLSPEDKRLLQSAAVVGYQVPLGVIRVVSELAPDDLREALVRLQAAEFLHEARLFPDLEYSFKHALVHDVAYHMLSPDRRRTLHAAALAAGEQYYADQIGEKADWLAFHAFRARIWDRALTHFRAAAARAIARAANRVAAQHLENALAALDHLPDQQRGPLAIDLRIDLRHALTPLGQVQRTLDHLRAAEQLATEIDDRPKLGRVVSFIANCLILQARYTEALVTGARALNIARELGDQRLELATQIVMVRARNCRGEWRPVIEMYKGIIHALDERPPGDFLGLPVLPTVVARSNLAIGLAHVGAFTEAAAYAREAGRRGDASGQPDSVLWANWGIGYVALLRGDSGEAVRVFDRTLDLCRAHDLDAYTSRIMALLGCAKARVGQVNEGLPLMEQAVALDASAEPQITRSLALTSLSEAYLLAGDLGKALTVATQAVQRTKALEERSGEAYACWRLATIQSALADDVEAAAGTFQTAMEIATELGLQPLLAHCYLGLSDLYERRGCRSEAGAHQERGQRLLTALGIKPWLTLGRRPSPASSARHST